LAAPGYPYKTWGGIHCVSRPADKGREYSSSTGASGFCVVSSWHGIYGAINFSSFPIKIKAHPA